MKPRILLINPWIYDFAAFNLWARPLGLLKVAEYLSAYGTELFFIDCTDSYEANEHGIGKYRTERVPKPDLLKHVPRHYKRYGMSIDEFKPRLRSFLPLDLVLVTSIMSYWYPGAQEAIRVVKEIAGSVPVILGGIYPTLYPAHALRHSGADHINSGLVQDQIFLSLKKLGVTPASARKPIPYYRLGFYPNQSFSPLLTSQGCPFHCSYCASRLLSGEYERKSIESIIGEIEEVHSRGVCDFAFYDDALLHNADHHIKPLLKAIIQRGFSVRFHAPNGLHARFVDDELAGLMRAANFTTIRLSFETVDGTRQKSTGGKVFTDDLVRSIRSLQKQGFTKKQIGVYLLYGLPDQGLEEVEDGIVFLQGLDVRIHLTEFSPIRGTTCWNDLVKSAIIPDDLDPILTNNTVFSYLYSGYDQARVDRIKIMVKEYNRV
jgi:uncharacterized radical SAM superfamily protein